MQRTLRCLVIFVVLVAGCSNKPPENKAQQSSTAVETEREPRTDREKLESEVREGSSLQDPGGAKDLRDSSTEQMNQQQEQVQEVDKQ